MNDLQLVRPARPNVWCGNYMVEGHIVTKLLMLWGINHLAGVARSLGAPPTAGVGVVGVQGAFPRRNNQEFCEICRAYGHMPWICPILQKYMNIPNNKYYEFSASTTHDTI